MLPQRSRAKVGVAPHRALAEVPLALAHLTRVNTCFGPQIGCRRCGRHLPTSRTGQRLARVAEPALAQLVAAAIITDHAANDDAAVPPAKRLIRRRCAHIN